MFRLTITQKFLAYVLLFGALPLLITGGAALSLSASSLQAQNERYAEQVVQSQVDYVELQQGQIESLIANLSGMESIRNTLQDEALAADTFTRLSTQAEIGEVLNTYINIQGLVSIDIFTLQGAHYSVGDTLLSDSIRPGLLNELWQRTAASDSSIVWLGIEENVNTDSSYQQVITATSLINQFNRNSGRREAIALLLVNYKPQELYEHFSQIDLGDDGYLIALDADNRYLYHPDRARLGQAADPELAARLRQNASLPFLRLEGQAVTVTARPAPSSGWLLASVVPLSTFTAQTTNIRNTVLVILGLSFMALGVTAFIYNRTVVAPIRQLTQNLQSLSHSPEGLHYMPPHRGRDEIGELVRWFNQYVDTLKGKQAADAEREKLIQDLQAATLQAQESDRLKSEFLATMSHELRTPLNAILGFTTIITDGVKGQIDADARDYLHRVEDNAQRLLALINDVLDLSRVESGRMVFKPRPFDPRLLAQSWHKQLSALALQKGLDFRYEVAAEVPEKLVADTDALSKIAVNLLGNAIKFTHEGQVTLSLAAHNGHWHLNVKDTGIGIPESALGLIFDEFRQVDQSSKRSYGGTGLGLAIVKRLAEAMGGRVEVHSQLGVGSSFSIHLPLDPQPTHPINT
jgi:signal transduction histidine kinase